MSAKLALPIIERVENCGHDIAIVAEGKAVGVCKEAGFQPLIEGTDELRQFGHSQVSRMLTGYSPAMLLIGLSSPINWELEFAQVAREFEIPVVALEDIWGGLTRLNGFVSDLALVIDSIADQETREEKRSLKCQIIGDIASMVNPTVPDEKRERAERLEIIAREKTVVLIVGDHTKNALELVELVAKSVRLERDPNQFVISHSLVHPKLVGTPEGEKILAPAVELLKDLTVDQFGGLSTDARAVRCNMTITAYSTPGRIALHAGKRFVSAWGPASHQLYQKECGPGTYPLVKTGVVPCLTEPLRLSELDWEMYDARAQNWAEQAKFRPEVALEAILGVLV